MSTNYRTVGVWLLIAALATAFFPRPWPRAREGVEEVTDQQVAGVEAAEAMEA